MENKEFSKLIAYVFLLAGFISNGIGFIIDIITFQGTLLSNINFVATTISWLFIIAFGVVCLIKKYYYFYSVAVAIITAFISFPIMLITSPDGVFIFYLFIIAPTFSLLSYKNKNVGFIGLAALAVYIIVFIIKVYYDINIKTDYLKKNLVHLIGGLSASYIFTWLITFYTTRKTTQLKSELEKRIYIDPLTKAKNRNALDEEEMKNSGILMIDIDFFKKLNDDYGHINGDKSLQFLVQTIKSLIRKEDDVIRYGGEEFIVVLRDIRDENMVFEIAEAIRYNVVTRSRMSDDIKCGFTISIGCCLYDENMSLEDNIKVVDSYLYSAKHAGRNQTFTNFV